MSQDDFRHSRRRAVYGEEEIWEMEYRGFEVERANY